MTDDERHEHLHEAAKNAANMLDLTEREDVHAAVEDLSLAVAKLIILYHQLGAPMETIAGAIGGATASTMVATMSQLA